MPRSAIARNLGRAAVTTIAVIGVTLTTVSIASAADRDGTLNDGEFGLYYNSNQKGCVYDHNQPGVAIADGDLSQDYFKAPSIYVSCAGEGQTVDNNAAAYWNRTHGTIWVYTGVRGGGLEGSLPSGYAGNASLNYKNAITSFADSTYRDIWKG
ncbi:peptidase inhibitor family I36 protein [Streptomyces poriferorum]|uniref:peptidase inhibitor family I36 protein n=1 Tax=Streptomyces TaxID=1883 RepID=UPI00273F772C|nr:peptidase inhibitor family I36 protein [Streptomyces sp. Alt1]WLQ47329.1 peptidase inhibitor family I36 protein [Streptomyces sp. Alt1]